MRLNGELHGEKNNSGLSMTSQQIVEEFEFFEVGPFKSHDCRPAEWIENLIGIESCIRSTVQHLTLKSALANYIWARKGSF